MLCLLTSNSQVHGYALLHDEAFTSYARLGVVGVVGFVLFWWGCAAMRNTRNTIELLRRSQEIWREAFFDLVLRFGTRLAARGSGVRELERELRSRLYMGNPALGCVDRQPFLASDKKNSKRPWRLRL